ncbi:hypothetical protein [Klebsiella variicola]|uniref:hypothetical protein n=1 Tax=Klebsiella variicola TaxID=244366 RepID=UPI00190EA573|nr:hypothetical protein [Klebsiella variicola]
MLDLEGIYKNVSVEDVLLYFLPITPYPSIDRMYVRYNFDAVANGELLRAYLNRILFQTMRPQAKCNMAS